MPPSKNAVTSGGYPSRRSGVGDQRAGRRHRGSRRVGSPPASGRTAYRQREPVPRRRPGRRDNSGEDASAIKLGIQAGAGLDGRLSQLPQLFGQCRYDLRGVRASPRSEEGEQACQAPGTTDASARYLLTGGRADLASASLDPRRLPQPSEDCRLHVLSGAGTGSRGAAHADAMPHSSPAAPTARRSRRRTARTHGFPLPIRNHSGSSRLPA